MNTLKKIALAVLVAASFGAVSTTAFAETDCLLLNVCDRFGVSD